MNQVCLFAAQNLVVGGKDLDFITLSLSLIFRYCGIPFSLRFANLHDFGKSPMRRKGYDVKIFPLCGLL